MVSWFSLMEESGFWWLMGQRDGFSGGFLLGTIVGGIVGGVVGTLLATRQFGESTETEDPGLNTLPSEAKPPKRKSLFKPTSERSDIEGARRSLEDKIAQLNEAIDDVRQQLGGVNGTVLGETSDQPLAKEPHRQN